MEKIWLKSYAPGVPAEIDPNEFRSLEDLAGQAWTRYADRIAFIQMGRTMTYGELDRLSRQFAAWLQKEAGLVRGDRIAIMLPNVLQYPIAMLGALRAGLTVVNTNPLYTEPELEHQIKDSGATAIVVLENFAKTLQDALPRTGIKRIIVTGAGDLLGAPKSWLVNYVVRHVRKQVPSYQLPGALRFRDVLEAGARLTLDPVDVGPEDIAYLQYTGGTTGVAKGAVLTHRNMVANVLQARAVFNEHECDPGSIYVVALPLYHIFSLTGNCLLFMSMGATGLLIINPRDFKSFLADLRRYPPNFMMGVNTLFNALMNTPGFERVDWSRLRSSVGGGMAVQGAVAERWKKMTGCVLSQGWGLTETSPVATMNPRGLDFNGSIGLPVPSTDVSIRDDGGNALAIGLVGEICVRGPQVMREYWNRPDETAKVMLPGGWLRTGDIGHIDERGFVYLEDRKKDMILVSGFNVYPNEVESVAVTHPGVLEAAAVSQPDERSGEAVAMFVVRKDPNLTAEEIIEHCRRSLTGYKVPKHVYFRTELPKTNVGKILRRALRDEVGKS